MATENKLTTVGQMQSFAQKQDARDDAQDELIRQLDAENDGFLTIAAQTLTDAQKAQVRTNTGTAAAVHGHDAATKSTDGFMSAADKAKLDGIATGATKVTVDSSLSSTSTNPVQNKVINTALAGKAASGHGHDAATTSAAGFMSADDKTKLDGITAGANKYTHPTYTEKSSGLYKVTVDGTGHVSAAAAVEKDDITALGIPTQDTTYSTGTSSKAGLTKLYASTGSSTDGTMTRAAITTALNGKETSGAAATALSDAKAYTDGKIAGLINSAPTTLDTLGEIATAMAENADVVEALETAIGNKADADHTHPAQTSVSGNAGTATKFASAQSVTLTGDVTGSASSQAGWSVATALASSGVEAGSYGPSADASPAHKGTFSVPYITVDEKGRVTAASTKTITLPADNNTTYTNVKLGQGYATCSTAAETTAKAATLSSYTLTTGGIVAVKFTYAVPASATLNVNSKGAKAMYHQGAAITAGVIEAGDTATFIYNGSQYHLISIDKPTTSITTAEIDTLMA